MQKEIVVIDTWDNRLVPIRVMGIFNTMKNRYVPDRRIYKVKVFTEKLIELAKQFIESGDFLWNAGIFTWN